ncbi:hypothetical protein LX16_2828 [Stackebrandtia albiflava]|uniref:Uncharacterized protein n=1 Tax=Stackebrandtia albiflava TaxID=406432 RepID=A0A562V2E6_9ACTN|nr:hypothetical protein [Stackebrandtia albiflava]TWJ12080.1 hypothetical protein LX16_2828 [Stackebrandtia albiflava]
MVLYEFLFQLVTGTLITGALGIGVAEAFAVVSTQVSLADRTGAVHRVFMAAMFLLASVVATAGTLLVILIVHFVLDTDPPGFGVMLTRAVATGLVVAAVAVFGTAIRYHRLWRDILDLEIDGHISADTLRLFSRINAAPFAPVAVLTGFVVAGWPAMDRPIHVQLGSFLGLFVGSGLAAYALAARYRRANLISLVIGILLRPDSPARRAVWTTTGDNRALTTLRRGILRLAPMSGRSSGVTTRLGEALRRYESVDAAALCDRRLRPHLDVLLLDSLPLLLDPGEPDQGRTEKAVDTALRALDGLGAETGSVRLPAPPTG